MNVGTNDADDLLKYKLVFDFRHAIIQKLDAAASGPQDLTGVDASPARDFQRGDILANTVKWRDSDVMDETEAPELVASLKRLLTKVLEAKWDVYVFGRFYAEGGGVHDTHMNQGSTGDFTPSGGR